MQSAPMKDPDYSVYNPGGGEGSGGGRGGEGHYIAKIKYYPLCFSIASLHSKHTASLNFHRGRGSYTLYECSNI